MSISNEANPLVVADHFELDRHIAANFLGWQYHGELSESDGSWLYDSRTYEVVTTRADWDGISLLPSSYTPEYTQDLHEAMRLQSIIRQSSMKEAYALELLKVVSGSAIESFHCTFKLADPVSDLTLFDYTFMIADATPAQRALAALRAKIGCVIVENPTPYIRASSELVYGLCSRQIFPNQSNSEFHDFMEMESGEFPVLNLRS